MKDIENQYNIGQKCRAEGKTTELHLWSKKKPRWVKPGLEAYEKFGSFKGNPVVARLTSSISNAIIVPTFDFKKAL
jgi:hypothetical protein